MCKARANATHRYSVANACLCVCVVVPRPQTMISTDLVEQRHRALPRAVVMARPPSSCRNATSAEPCRSECDELLNAPDVVPISSASFHLAFARHPAVPAPLCMQGIGQMRVEYVDAADSVWRTVSAQKANGTMTSGVRDSVWLISHLRCPHGCKFRWGPSGSMQLSAQALLLQTLHSHTRIRRPRGWRWLCSLVPRRKSACSAIRAKPACVQTLSRLFACRGRNMCALWRCGSLRGARKWCSTCYKLLTEPLSSYRYNFASLLPLPRSDIYGGELTQYLDRGAGLQKFVDERGLRLERVTLPPGVVATTRLSSPTALGTTSGSLSMGTFILTILLVAIAAAAIARYGIPRTVRVWLRNTGLWGWGSTNGAKRHMHVPTEDAVEEEQEALTASPSAPIVPKLSTRAIGSYIDTPALAPDPHDPEGSPRYDGSLVRSLEMQDAQDDGGGVEDDAALQHARLLIATMFSGSVAPNTSADESVTTTIDGAEDVRPHENVEANGSTGSYSLNGTSGSETMRL